MLLNNSKKGDSYYERQINQTTLAPECQNHCVGAGGYIAGSGRVLYEVQNDVDTYRWMLQEQQDGPQNLPTFVMPDGNY